MGMKFLPLAVSLSCAVLLIGCNRAPAPSAEDKETQDRLAEEAQAQQLSALHEREAALDERAALLDEREKLLNVAASPAPGNPAEQPAPVAVGAPPMPAPAQEAAAAPEATDATYQTFYDNLSPYGTWVPMPGYNYVWQPYATTQNAGWRPYTLGHWAYTDAGWTWVSDEPFGWITYHYGRWMRTHVLGWVWVPGDQWAPAWVSWRYGDDFAGWAPLPPEARFDGAIGIQQWADAQYDLGASDYTFVPASEFGDEDMADEQVPPDQVEPIYADSNNITNIYYDADAEVIICYGPNYDFMRAKSRRGLPPPYKLNRGGYSARGKNGATISGNTLHIPAPRIVRGGRPAAPRTTGRTISDSRLVSPATTPHPHGAGAPPIYRPPQPVAILQQTAPAPYVPAQVSRIPMAPPAPAAIEQHALPPPTANNPLRTQAAETIRPPAPTAPADTQRSRDQEIIQQNQDAEREAEARRAEAAKAAATQQQAEEARAQQAAAEAQAAHEQAERAQAVREEAAQAAAAARQEAVHANQPVAVPAGSPGR